MSTNILLCGVGGQGSVLASKMIAAAAMARDLPVMSAETIGMAQKGGSVCSYIRIGDGVHAPMFPKGSADVIIGFEPAEAVRMLPYLKKDGAVVVNSAAVKPVTAVLADSGYEGPEMIEFLKGRVADLLVVDCLAACRELGSPRVANMVLLGAAAKTGRLFVTIDDLDAVMRRRVKPQFHELNARALRYAGAK